MIDGLTAPEFTQLFASYTNLIVTTALNVTTAYALLRDVNDDEIREIIEATKQAAEEITAGYIAALDKRGEKISENDAVILKARLSDAALIETQKLIKKAAQEIRRGDLQRTAPPGTGENKKRLS